MPFLELFLSASFSVPWKLSLRKLISSSGFHVCLFRRCLIYNVLICLCPATLRLSPSAAVPIYLTTLIRLCQELFSGIFSASNRFSRFVPPPPVQLSYSIRFLPACQVLFSSFFKTFFGPQHSIAEWCAALAERLA